MLRKMGAPESEITVRLTRDMNEGGLTQRLSLYHQLEERLQPEADSIRNA
jgi:hypothetical protein